MVYSQARRSLLPELPGGADGPEKRSPGSVPPLFGCPGTGSGGTAEAPGSIPHRCPKSNGLPPLCLYNGQGADLLQDPSVFLFAEGSVRQGRPGSSCFYTSLREGGGPVHPVDPAPQRTPPRLPPWGEAWGSVYFCRGAYHAPTPCTEKSRPAAGRASIAISYFRHRFKVGEPGPQEPLRLLLGPKGCPFSLIKFQVKGDHVLHCGLRRGECAPLIAPAAVIPVGASVGVAPHVLGGHPGACRSTGKRSALPYQVPPFVREGCSPPLCPSGYAWIPDTECPVSYRAAIFSQSGPGPPAKRQGRTPPPGLRKREESPAGSRRQPSSPARIWPGAK